MRGIELTTKISAARQVVTKKGHAVAATLAKSILSMVLRKPAVAYKRGDQTKRHPGRNTSRIVRLESIQFGSNVNFESEVDFRV